MCDPSKCNTFVNAKIVGNIGLVLNGVPIPEEILILILSFIEPGRLLTISMVCKNWCIIVRSYTFWNDKYRRKCGHQAKRVPWDVFYCLFTRKCFINVLTNCNGDNGFNGWRSDVSSGLEIQEAPPTNIPECKGFVRCFTTSLNCCFKYQKIYLKHDCLLLKVVRLVHPRILLTDWVTARIKTEITHASTIQFFGLNGKFIYESLVNREVESFGNSWIKLQRVIEDYPISFKSICFQHLVLKKGIWDVDSGIKIAGTVMKFDFECINLNVS